MNIEIKLATVDDVTLILKFIKELAAPIVKYAATIFYKI